MEKQEIINVYGFDPEDVGIRHRGYAVVVEIEDEEIFAGASIGDLRVTTRDGEEFYDERVDEMKNFIDTCPDLFDSTFLHYYFTPLERD